MPSWTSALLLAALAGAVPPAAGARGPAPPLQGASPAPPSSAGPSALDPDAAAAALLERHLATLGGSAGLARSLDLELSGTLESAARRASWRLCMRGSPFAVREEFGHEGSATFVSVTDGDQAWRLRRDGTSAPLPGAEAVAALENAFLHGFRYATHARIEGVWDGSAPLEEWSADLPAGIERRPLVRALSLRTPLGTSWLLFFGADGRLYGVLDQEIDPPRWRRFGRWKDFGGVEVPTLIAAGQGAATLHVLHVEGVRTGVRHDPALFAGDPEPPIEGVVPLGPIRRVRSAVPGSGYLAMPGVTAGAIATWAYVDTGAGDVLLEPSLARELDLPFLGRERMSGGVNAFVARLGWLDALALPARRFLQLPVTSAQLPGSPDFVPSQRPRMVLGGRVLFGGSPVFDLDAGELRLRGPPVVPLKDAAPHPGVARVPLLAAGPSGPFSVEVSLGGSAPVPVLLDTGCPYALRLAAGGLRRAGLPTSRAAWLERGGGLALPYAGVGGDAAALDLLVRLDEIALGPVSWRRPWVLLAGLGGEDEASELWYEGLLGAGALLAFARFGLDLERGVLELEPGAGIERAAEDLWVVPDPGQFLGLALEAGEEVSDPVLALPRVYLVAAGSAAAAAGVRRGDRLLAIDGIPCTLQAPAQLQRELWLREGGRVALSFFREGRGRPFDVVLP